MLDIVKTETRCATLKRGLSRSALKLIDVRRGEFYRPVKQPVTIRLDADVLSWFKQHADGRGYQTEINRVLRTHVAEREKEVKGWA